jgi:hypothetical protein
MRLLLLSLALLASTAAHAVENRILQCNVTFGDIAEVDIYQSETGVLTADLLTNSGSSESGGTISAADWQKRDMNFEYGKGFRAGRLHFFQNGRNHWMYEEFSFNSGQASDTGSSDCTNPGPR